MGTDVHPYVEVRLKTGQWKRAYVSLSRDRNYTTFAIIANVRNGFGFAGVPTHETLIPIALPRGLPPDTSIRDNDTEDYRDPEHVWLGDHSVSWLTLAELKSYDLDQVITETGVVSGANRELVKAGKVPLSWCGAKHPMTPDDEQMEWQRPLRKSAYLLAEWIKQLEDFTLGGIKYKDEDIRVVFGFDS